MLQNSISKLIKKLLYQPQLFSIKVLPCGRQHNISKNYLRSIEYEDKIRLKAKLAILLKELFQC